MLRKTTLLILTLSISGVAAAGAQSSAGSRDDRRPVEATLFLGLLRSDSLDSIGPGAKLDFDEDLDLGLAVSFPTRFDDFQVELIYSRNEMELTADLPGQPVLAFIDQQYLHVGGLWELGDGDTRGFATASVGVVELDPEGAFFDAKTLPSFGVGGGGKFYVHEHVAFRLEGRILGHVGDGRMFCNPVAGCLGQPSGALLMQFQAAAGLTVRF